MEKKVECEMWDVFHLLPPAPPPSSALMATPPLSPSKVGFQFRGQAVPYRKHSLGGG